MAERAVDDDQLTIPSGQFVGIVGHTGSGKTTLVQLIDGLLKPTAGSCTFGRRGYCIAKDLTEGAYALAASA